MRWPPTSPAGRIAAVYLAAGIAWFAAADLVEAGLIPPGSRELARNLEGWLFVAAGALLLYGLVRREQRRSPPPSHRPDGARETTDRPPREAVFVVDVAGRSIVACNEAAERMFGYDRDEMIGSSTRLLHVDEEHWHEFARRSDPAVAQHGTWRGEFELQQADGTVIRTRHTVSLLEGGEDGRVTAASLVRRVTGREEPDEEPRRP